MNKKRIDREGLCRELLIRGGLILAASSLAAVPPVAAEEFVLSGASESYLRLQRTTDGRDKAPLTEYLRVSAVTKWQDGAATSFQIGGWGRVDLGDGSRDGDTAGDLQYGYLSYQGARNNLAVNVGRQFITEGVAAQRLDGLYVRSDLGAGFAAAAFAGAPVVTEPSLPADDLVFGGRISHGNGSSYTIGFSALQSRAAGERYREEQGIDFWLHPARGLDLTGRSSYNSVTGGFMEHSYTASFTPGDKLQLHADLSQVDYRNYFYRVTTNAFAFDPVTNGIDPHEKLFISGGGASCQVTGNVAIAGDYRRYDYDIAGVAAHYGGSIRIAGMGPNSAGFSLYRMDGTTDLLRYTEYRLFAATRLGKAGLTLDVTDIDYDKGAGSGKGSAIALLLGGSYELREDTRLGASLDYSRNALFDNELKGVFRLTYLFEVSRPGQGGKTSDK